MASKLDDLLGPILAKRGEGWTEFAARAGIDPKTLWNIRNGVGKRKPTRGVCMLIAKAAKLPLAKVEAAVQPEGNR